MGELHVAFYARVSSDRQVEDATIASQVAALEERIAADGETVPGAWRFMDEGYSGGTLARPALERLRDLVATGLLDRLYLVHPDRLARDYPYQRLLLDEFRASEVEVIFLNHALGQSPTDRLLLGVQGVMAEYERALIVERSRRGRRYHAQQGEVRALGKAPYGYRYASAHETGGAAQYVVVAAEARVVRQIFTWVAEEGCPLNEICRRLTAAGEPTRGGGARWERRMVWEILANSAYRGEAAFGTTRNESYRPPLRPARGAPSSPRQPAHRVPVPPEEWIMIPVPALVSVATWEAAQAQLGENRRVRSQQRPARYLLTGVICCARCGYACVGHRIWKRDKGREHCYYRCQGTDARRYGGEAVCTLHPLPMESVDRAVWQEVCTVLADPVQMLAEYERRLIGSDAAEQQEQESLRTQQARLQRGRARLIDSYTDEVITKEDFLPRLTRFDARLAAIGEQLATLHTQQEEGQALRLVISRFEDFAQAVATGLAEADLERRRAILQILVKRVEIDDEVIRVVFRVPPPQPSDHDPPRLHDWENQATSNRAPNRRSEAVVTATHPPRTRRSEGQPSRTRRRKPPAARSRCRAVRSGRRSGRWSPSQLPG